MQDAFYQEARWLYLKLNLLDIPAFSSTIHQKLSRKKKFHKVLDCGTGIGNFISVMEKLIEFDKLVAFDVNSDLIEKAIVNFKENNKIKFLVHNLYDTEKLLISNDFDLVIGLAFLEHTFLDEAIPILKRFCKSNGYMYFAHNYMSPTIFQPTFDDVIDRRIVTNFDGFSIENQIYKEKRAGDSRCGAKLFSKFCEHGLDIIHFECTDWLLYPKPGGYSKEEAEILRMLVNFFYQANKNPLIPLSLRVGDKILDEWKFTRLSQIEENKLVFICPQTSILVKN